MSVFIKGTNIVLLNSYTKVTFQVMLQKFQHIIFSVTRTYVTFVRSVQDVTTAVAYLISDRILAYI
jgi:hypothetical protein